MMMFYIKELAFRSLDMVRRNNQGKLNYLQLQSEPGQVVCAEFTLDG